MADISLSLANRLCIYEMSGVARGPRTARRAHSERHTRKATQHTLSFCRCVGCAQFTVRCMDGSKAPRIRVVPHRIFFAGLAYCCSINLPVNTQEYTSIVQQQMQARASR